MPGPLSEKFYPDKVAVIDHPHPYLPDCFVAVLDGIADDVVDDAAHLLGIGDKLDILPERFRKSEAEAARLRLKPKILRAIPEKLRRRHNRKVVGDAVRVDFRIKR